MTAVAAAPAQGAASRPRRRRVWVWVVIAIVLVVVGGLGAAVTASLSWSSKNVLDPDSAGPNGARALAQVLRAHGVDVEVTHDREGAVAALGPESTLVIASTAILSDDALRAVTAPAAAVVLIDPANRDLRVLFDGAQSAGFGPDSPIDPQCPLPAADRAGAVVPGTLFAPGGTEVGGCYPTDDAFGLLHHDNTVAVDGSSLFVNERVAENGNAALALGLLGRSGHVVWYVPGLMDADPGTTAPTVGELTPPWVTPVILLLLCAGVVAAIWRGRRFGPLVAENLPVTVRAAETTAGRAHLYTRSRDASHALDGLRLGARERIAALLGLGAAAQPGDIADAAADRIGAPRDVVRGILIDTVPRTDADLVAASDRLRDLEAAIRSSVHVERTDP